MRILVTGGAGFIGSHLVDRLVEAGHRVRVLDNLSTGNLANLPDAGDALEFVEGDVTDPGRVRDALEGIECVAHLAAIASVQASVENPAATHEVNFHGTLNLLEGMRVTGCRRIAYASSAAVYGNRHAPPVSEKLAADPLTPYAVDKLAGERYLSFYRRQFGIESAIFRFFNVFGPRQDPASPYSGVISIFCDRARSGKAVTVFGDGEQTRDFVYVGDVVAILATALLQDTDHDGPANVGMGVATSVNQLVGYIRDMTGATFEVGHAEARTGEVRHSMADIRVLKERFPGQVPSTPVREGLRRLLESI